MSEVISNLALWDKVEKTNTKYTKDTSKRDKHTGEIIHKSTAINASYQQKNATREWGAYGTTWGLKNTKFNFELLEATDLVMYSAVFYYPGGEFEISNSIAVRVGFNKYVDKDFAKKVETDTLTKALSKLGFNADIFMGEWDDDDYVAQLQAEEHLEASENREEALKAQMKEIKEAIKHECETLKKLPSPATINNFATKIYKKATDKLKAYNFPPDTLHAFIENRVNEAITALTEQNETK